MASANDSSSSGDNVGKVEEFTPDDILERLSNNDDDPKILLDHREIPYVLAEWLYNDDWRDTNKYQKVEDAVNWNSGKVMPKGRFTDALEGAWEEKVEEQEENKEPDIPEMDPDEFYEAFNWNRMKDREIARKCHLWCRANANIVFSNEQVLVYDENEGVWVPGGRGIGRELQKLLRGQYGENVKREFIEGYVKEHPDYHVDWDEMGMGQGRCHVENGVLDLVDGEIVKEIEPEDYALFKFPVKWRGLDAEREEFEEQFLKQSVAPGDRKVLQEFAGTMLDTNVYPHKKALMCLGEGDNGKGVFEKILIAVLGGDQVMNDDLSDIAGAQFGLQRLRYSVANINSDIADGEIKHFSTFKKLTGGDPIRVEPKGETPYEIQNYAKLMFAANSIPQADTDDLAFYRRWLFVEFPNRFTQFEDDGFPDADPELGDRIIENELSGVLAWMVEGYQRWHEQGRFSTVDRGEDIREQWYDYSDTTATFVRNFVEPDPRPPDDPTNRPIRVDEMYAMYEDYVETTPTSPKPKQRLAAYIKNRYGDDEDSVTTEASRQCVYEDEDKDAVRVWKGVHVPQEKRVEISQTYDKLPKV
jgi:P4 family phage/plasmid primase-like protien